MTATKSVYDQLAERIMIPGSERIPRLFRMAVSEEEAEMLLALPGFAPALTERFGISEDDIHAAMGSLFTRGLVFKSNKPEGPKYRMCRDVMQFHDAAILMPGVSDEFLDLWRDFMEIEWPEYSKLVEGFFPKPAARIIPINQPFEAQQRILASESCREIIEQASAVAVTECTCRKSMRKCDNELEVCLQIGKSAAYAIDRGTGREITKDEALEIIDRSEKAGLVHMTMNKVDNLHFICNCCKCCCFAMPVIIEYGRKLVDPSRFAARVHTDDCPGCEDCIDECMFGALAMTDDDGYFAEVDEEKCMGCGVCVHSCPTEAINLHEVREHGFVPGL